MEQRIHSHMQMRLVSLRDAETKKFTKSKLDLVDALIDEMWGQSAFDISQNLYGKAWQGKALKESIPYEEILLSDDPLSLADIHRTYELAEKHDRERDASHTDDVPT
ncbi:MAG: hypothetical protein OXC93_03430 [Rhodospirillaceae bacterium]|nr:hypothetical protein [Rhodospirillaceae bacterium]